MYKKFFRLTQFSLFAFLINLPGTLSAQELEKAFRVTYQSYENDQINDGGERSFLFSNNVAYLSKFDSKTRNFIDYNQRENVTLFSYKGDFFKTVLPFDSLSKPIFDSETEKILNYNCKHAIYTAFSNKIEIWYTDKSKVKGSLYSQFLPTENCLVLKIVINGNRTFLASSIEKDKEAKGSPYDSNSGTTVSSAVLEELKIRSRYTTINVFDHEQLNFDPSIPVPTISEAQTGITYSASNGTVILKKIKLPELISEGAYVHAKLTSWSNGDAYDRTGSIFIIPELGSKGNMLSAFEKGIEVLPVFMDNDSNNYQGIQSDWKYNCPIEIMRFFTSFGVRHFNELRPINGYPWADSVIYNQEISSLIPTNVDEIWVGVFIGNYDKGGHIVNLDFNIYPSFEPKPVEKWIQPLFNTVNVMEMSGQNYGKIFKTDTLRVTFEIPQNVSNVNLLYTSTGHGGWGNGDEFNPKLNQIRIDNEAYYSVIPWRTDCASYRFSNPASGNFENGLSSSDLSRSNWCPATVTPPYIIPLTGLSSGLHTVEVIIDQGEDEGGSFSHWSVSGVLVGEVDF